MSAPASDRNLLLGILALDLDFVTADGLIQAMRQWMVHKSRSLSEILVERGALDSADRNALDQLVDRHIARHGGDARNSLSALDVPPSARSVLEAINDPDIQASLSSLSTAAARRVFDAGSVETESLVHAALDGDGRYRVLRLHKEGGLGIVYLARDTEVNRDVALKRLKDANADDPQSRARFVFEAEVTGNLEHPGVVPVYGIGKDADGRPYYAMRFVKGDTLKEAVDHLHRDRDLAADSAARQREFRNLLRRFLTVCETMEYAHSRHIIHRDLKPRNILLGPDGETLVVDWGLAKVMGRAEGQPPSGATLRPPSSSEIDPTVAGAMLGTLAFMSPEQARGESRIGPASDIYGLGATLYYLLTARPPFDAPDQNELIRKVQNGEFRPPREARSTVDRGLDAVCRKAMALKPEDRYASAEAFAEDLERWLADQAVNAYAEPVWLRSRRWLRKRKGLVGTAMAGMLLVLVGLAWHDFRLGHEQAQTKLALNQVASQQGLTRLALGQTSAQLKMTRAALRQLLKVAGENLALAPNFEKLREELARLVLDSFKSLRERFPTDREISLEMAQVYFVVAGIEGITGQFEKSRRSSDQAIELLKQLCEAAPAQIDYRRWMVDALIERGAQFQMYGKSEEAEIDFRAGLRLVEGLVSEPMTYRRCKGSALINLSEILVLKSKLEDAQIAAAKAVDLLQPLAQSAQPTDRTPSDRWLFAMALTDRGVALKLTGARRAAARDFLDAERVCMQVLGEKPDYSDVAYQLACILNQRGDLLASDPRTRQEALNAFKRAAELLDKLIAGHKSIPYYREELVAGLIASAGLHASDNCAELARKDCESARAHVQRLIESQQNAGTPGNARHLSLLGRALELSSRIRNSEGQRTQALQELSAAVAALDRCIELDPSRKADKSLAASLKHTLEGMQAQGDTPAHR
jgi:serine/threonine-protein kinase